MSLFCRSPDNGGPPQSELIIANPASKDCCQRMGWTSENVAVDYNISREEQDEFAARSFQHAENAQKAGYFAKEIVPFTVFREDQVTGKRTQVIVTEDDGIRYGTTKETLSKIRAAFPQWGNGTTTGGNASQITDGAAAVLLMSRKKAEELGLRILGRHVTTSVAGRCFYEFAPRQDFMMSHRGTPTRNGDWPRLCNSYGSSELWNISG